MSVTSVRRRDAFVTLPFDKFACQGHWFSLPPELRGRISRLWRDQGQDLTTYLAAREEAVAMLSAATEPRP